MTVKAETLSVSDRPSERLQVSLHESIGFVHYPPQDVEALTVLIETARIVVCHDNDVLSVGVSPVLTIRGKFFEGSLMEQNDV